MVFSEYVLSFSEDTWKLSTSNFSPNFSLELRIKFAFHGTSTYNDVPSDWCEYQFVAHFDDRQSVLVVTNEEWDAQVDAIRENEGGEAAYRWVQSSVCTCPAIDCTWADAMREFKSMVRSWEAMLQLRLFAPTVTMTPFPPIG